MNEFSEKQVIIKNTGFKDRPINKLGVLHGIIISMAGYSEFATASAAMALSGWETKQKATKTQRTFFFPMFDSVEDKSTEDVYADTLQGQKFREDGKMQVKGMIDCDKYMAVNLRSFNGKNVEVFLFDESASIWGTTPDGTKFKGMKATVRVGMQKLAAKGERVLTPVEIIFQEPRQWNEEGAVIEPMNQSADWNPKTDIDGVYDVNLATSAATVTSCKITVKKAGIDPTMTISAVDGLVKADFVLKTSAGVVKTITTLTETGVSGEYTLVATLANSDTIELVSCASISLTTIKIEGVAPTTLVIS